ncbi:hypothetical protein L2E82_35867 [Cichorium intybus]|uniref:Uncharacterized protein n=1 Tax=Cichorium intybus TaxID=13427 RepID=A0ACB9BPY8_CICIN|nr:hypothetical protein L2E82_35867 [Cichorium intybus]
MVILKSEMVILKSEWVVGFLIVEFKLCFSINPSLPEPTSSATRYLQSETENPTARALLLCESGPPFVLWSTESCHQNRCWSSESGHQQGWSMDTFKGTREGEQIFWKTQKSILLPRNHNKTLSSSSVTWRRICNGGNHSRSLRGDGSTTVVTKSSLGCRPKHRFNGNVTWRRICNGGNHSRSLRGGGSEAVVTKSSLG